MNKSSIVLKSLFTFAILCFMVFVSVNVVQAEEREPEVTNEGTLNVKTMLYDTDVLPEFQSYTVGPEDKRIVTFTADYTGLLYLDFQKTAGDSKDYPSIYFSETYESIDWGGYDGRCFGAYDAATLYENNGGFPVTAGKKYCVVIMGCKYNDDSVSVQIRGKVYTTAQRTLSKGKTAVVSGKDDTKQDITTWFKIKATKTGELVINVDEYGYDTDIVRMTLCNNKKKAVSEEEYYNSSHYLYKTAKFGVQKGKTYYLKVTEGSGEFSECCTYGIKYSITRRTDRSISKKTKAKKITGKATKTLFVATGKTSTDWYKFTVKNNNFPKIQIDTTNLKSGTITVTAYKGKTKLSSYKQNMLNKKKTVQLFGHWKMSPKGTYYIKISKGKTATGTYTIRYVK